MFLIFHLMSLYTIKTVGFTHVVFEEIRMLRDISFVFFFSINFGS